MADQQERAEAFLKYTLAYVDALDEGMKAYAHGYPTSTELVTLPIRSLAVKVRHAQAKIARLEERQRDDDARSRKRWTGEAILPSSSNIVPSLQYCPKSFIVGRVATHTHKKHCSEMLARSFLGVFDAGVRSLQESE